MYVEHIVSWLYDEYLGKYGMKMNESYLFSNKGECISKFSTLALSTYSSFLVWTGTRLWERHNYADAKLFSIRHIGSFSRWIYDFCLQFFDVKQYLVHIL